MHILNLKKIIIKKHKITHTAGYYNGYMKINGCYGGNGFTIIQTDKAFRSAHECDYELRIFNYNSDKPCKVLLKKRDIVNVYERPSDRYMCPETYARLIYLRFDRLQEYPY